MPHAQRQRKPAAPRSRNYRVGEKMRCYEAGTPVRANRYNEIPVETALELISEKSAEWVDDYKAIRMFARKAIEMSPSFVLTVVFMEGVGNGDYYPCKLLKMMDPRKGRKVVSA